MLVGFGCSGSDAGTDSLRKDAGSTVCQGRESLDGPDVSFERDLMPFFSVSCAFNACHDGYGRQAGLYLGPNFLDGGADASAIAEVHESLLGRSTMAPALHRVVPFDPEKGFLMIKLRGCQNRVGLECTGAVVGKPCGDRMPDLSDELPLERKSMFARWIARGAAGPSSDGGARIKDGAAP